MSNNSTVSTVIRVLLIILGFMLASFGIILTIVFAALMIEESDLTFAFLLPFALSTAIGGVVIIVGQVSAMNKGVQVVIGQGQEDLRSFAPSTAEMGAASTQSAAASKPQAPAAAPVVPAEGSSSASAEAPAEDVAHLVFRSDDLFATLRDLVRHELTASSDKFHLATMLDAAGVMNWTDAPACEGGRLSRNTHFWIRLSTDDLTDEQYDTLVATEAALSVNQDLPLVRTMPLNNADATAAALDLMRMMVDQTIDAPALTAEGMRAAYRTDQSSPFSEWAVRSRVCNAAESLRTPFRVDYDFRCDVSDKVAVLGIEIPRPRCMAIFTTDRSQQAALARAYALRLSALLARHVFEASGQIETVFVNCHEHAQEDTLLSLNLTREILVKLLSAARSAQVESGFPQDRAIRAQFAHGWFEPVEPFVALDSARAIPELANIFPELDDRTPSQAVCEACHAQRISDLGINENAARISAWDLVRPKLGTTTSQAVSALVEARDKTRDITVAEACTRVITSLVEGSSDLEKLGDMAELFIDGSALDQALARANRLLDDTDGTPDPEAALRVLEEALAPIEDMGAYLDDETTAYRYFTSVSERIRHNEVVDEGGRTISLVPDAYYNAHSAASVALGMLGRLDEALNHANICLRLAPISTGAALRKVRVLEEQSRIYEAADLIISTLRNAVTPRDAAICHYRLAYMEWKLGREDVAIACYQRALTWDTEIVPQTREELDDLLDANKGLKRLTSEEADALLAREGIPLGCVRTDFEHTLGAAIACMDDHAFYSARGLMAALYAMDHDDVIMGVYRSLSVSS